MIVKYGARLLLKRGRRTAEAVRLEYELGSWHQALTDQRWVGCKTLRDYLVPDSAESRVALVDGRIVAIPTAHYYRHRLQMIQDLVAAQAEETDCVCELGCGPGLNIFSDTP